MDTNKLEVPKTLQAAIEFFADEENCIKLLISRRWPNGMACPHCGSIRVGRRGGRAVWLCKDCRKEFTLKTRTFMEDSPIKLGKWLAAMWLITNCKNGVSSYEIHRALGVTQKTAWFMLHRIRLAFGDQPTALQGTVESDETVIGGLEKNKHKSKKIDAAGPMGGKTVVMALLERSADKKTSRARTQLIEVPTRKSLQAEIKTHVTPGSKVFTDSSKAYTNLPPEFVHDFVNHAVAYVRDNVHTNGLENFFALLKRTIRGTYVAIDPAHLRAYLDEQTFRFNERKDDDSGRFMTMLGGIYGKRLTYQDLINAYDPYIQTAY